METKQGSLFYLPLPFHLPLLSVRKERRQPQRVGGIKREAGGSCVVGVYEDQRWQVYLLTPTSGDADTNPARSALFSLEARRSAAVCKSSVVNSGGAATFLWAFSGYPPTVYTEAAASATTSCRRVLMYLAETF